jgi:uncharacterized tellurite resistance protein B-like protein
MSLLRFLGMQKAEPTAAGETETVRRIAARLETLPPGRARHLAAFAYVLARVAHADLEIDAAESAQMEQLVIGLGGLAPAEAALVVEIAKSQARLLGGTENYVVTREFRRIASAEERAGLLECAFAVAAADGEISAVESAECLRIAEELGFTREEGLGIRNGFRDKLALLRRPGHEGG